MEYLIVRAFLSMLPILFALFMLVVLRKSAKKVMPLSWVLTVILAAFFWKMPLNWIIGASIYGILTSLNILVIIFGAILLLNILKISGAIESISANITSISSDRRIQALILAYGFALLIEGAAGFGTPAALAAPLLVLIGFPPIAAAIIALIGHAPGVSFGAAGAPIIGGIGAVITQDDLPFSLKDWLFGDIAIWSARFHILGSILVPVLIVLILGLLFSKERKLKSSFEALPLAFLAGIVFTVVQNSTAYLLGPELPTIIGGAAVIIVIIFMAWKKILLPHKSMDFPDTKDWPSNWQGIIEQQNIPFKGSQLKAWFPYLAVIVLLLITRIEAIGLKSLFLKPSLQLEEISRTTLNWQWNWLYNPGVFPFILVSVISFFVFKLKRADAIIVGKKTGKQLFDSSIAMGASVAMAQLMMNSDYNLLNVEGMLTSLAVVTAEIFRGNLYPLVAPWIGVLGSFMSGSNTVSNILFARYQFEVAVELNFSKTIILALQSAGAAVGNMIAIHNVIAVLTVVGCLGREGLVIKKNMLAVILYSLLLGIMGLVFLTICNNVF